MSYKPICLRLNILDRILMVACMIAENLLFVGFLLKLTHYIAIPMPGLFSSPSLVSSPHTQPTYLLNFGLYFSFFASHVVMSLLVFKSGMRNLISKYPLYERYIYNIFSSWFYMFMLEVAQPVTLES